MESLLFDLLRFGRLGSLCPGMSSRQVLQALGPPQDYLIRNGQLWYYRDLEVSLWRGRVELITVYFFRRMKPAIPRRLLKGRRGFPTVRKYGAFTRYLRRHEISYRIAESFAGCRILEITGVEPWVQVEFDEGRLQGIYARLGILGFAATLSPKDASAGRRARNAGG